MRFRTRASAVVGVLVAALFAVPAAQAAAAAPAGVEGGQYVYGGIGRCALGFNVRRDDAYYLATLSLCGSGNWYADAAGTVPLGTYFIGYREVYFSRYTNPDVP